MKARDQKLNSGMELSIRVASEHVAKGDIFYHRQLSRIDAMALGGRDTKAAEQMSLVLKDSLDRTTAWLQFLRGMQD